jgi:serine/threonine protein kinase
MAPEITQAGNEYSDSVDIYSFGCVLVEMLTQKTMRDLPEDYNAKMNILDSWLKAISSPLKDVALRCLAFNPAKRPSASQVTQNFYQSETKLS